MTAYNSRRAPSLPIIIAIVVALTAGVGIGVFATHRSSPSTTSSSSATTTTTVSAPGGGATTTTGAPVAALTVGSSTPANGATGVSASAAISVTFSDPVAAGSPTPSLAPPVQGSWSVSGATLTFTPSVPIVPLTTEVLTVPSGSGGVRATNGATLASTYTANFRVQNGSIVRLQQLLSLLDYSPLAWTATGTEPAAGDANGQAAALYTPPDGTFAWRQGGWPSELRSLWRQGSDSVFTRGLLMSFQADAGLTPNGQLGPGVWGALLTAVAENTVNTGGYNYALADKSSPERLRIWHDGARVLDVAMNTGIAGSPTPDGNFPVNTRLRRQVMRGTNPSGTKYADLVQYIAYFHGNDAVHYMDRANYGIPQSLGCIELRLADAAKAWPLLAYGTIVSVIN